MFNKKITKKIRLLFPIFKKRIYNKDLVYFDNSSTTQKPVFLINSIVKYYTNYNSNINRLNNSLSNRTNLLIYKTRKIVKKFIRAKHSREIIFTSGTTESINLISQSIKFNEGDEIIISPLEHHSNILPWQILKKKKKIKIRVLKLNKRYNITVSKIFKYINKKTKIISITHISNVFGTILPIKKIVEAIKKINNKILILLDGAQSIAHIPIDVQAMNIDFFVFSAHKVYGPTGLGILYGKKKELKKLNKYKVGGNMVQNVSYKKADYLGIPYKFEAGTPNISSIVSFYYTVRFLIKIGLKNIYKYEKKLLKYTIKLLIKNKNIIIYGGNKINSSSILSFNIKGLNSFDVGCFLNKYNIFVRTGYQCAQPLFKLLKIKDGCVRISYGMYNNIKEINKFYRALLNIIKKYL